MATRAAVAGLMVACLSACASSSSHEVTPTSVAQTTTILHLPMLEDFRSRAQVPIDIEITIGHSVNGQPISVVRRGGGDVVTVMLVGCIHGDESAGREVVRVLRHASIPRGVDLWLVESMNPDGAASGMRLNAHGVDLNRNFPPTWAPLGHQGDWQFAGPEVASEPETRAMVGLGSMVRPDIVLWYHQDLNRISPGSGREGRIRARYGELTGLPIVGVTGGTYTGTANRWGKSVVPPRGVSFTVELGPSLTDVQARAHARAVLVIAREFFP